jgi:anti-sigma B factor antagonist
MWEAQEARAMSVIERTENGVVVLVPAGRLDTQGAAGLNAALQRAVSEGRHKMVVDMSQVRYINSAGLRTLVDVLARNRKENGDVKLVALDRNVAHVFRTIGFDRLFAIYDTLEAAIADF